MIFDPVLAHRLGWHPAADDPFSFVGADMEPIATTRFWRDGWQQQMSQAYSARWAKGQRIELTEAGRAEIERYEGAALPITTRWRTIGPRRPKPKCASVWRSDEKAE